MKTVLLFFFFLILIFDYTHFKNCNFSAQRMVMSLSSDKAVWDAVMNNEVVRELRETYYAGWLGVG